MGYTLDVLLVYGGTCLKLVVSMVAVTLQGLTSGDSYEQAGLLQVLLRMQCGNGLMHESVHVSGGL
jgi:meiotically up-regulated gene 157 (Mug157) protein